MTAVFVYSQAASANEKCLTGSAGNNHLIQQFESAKKNSAITKSLLSKYNITTLPTPVNTDPNCTEDCLEGISPYKFENIQAIRNNILPKPTIKLACLEAAASAKSGSAERHCPSGKTVRPANSCITASLLQYQNAVITDFHKCIKTLTDAPITMSSLFEMYSQESHFRPNYSYTGGQGLGQVTSIFVKDTTQKHRGLDTLKKIGSSQSNECAIAKTIAKKDVQKLPVLNNNKCGFIQYGEGVERNILHTMVGLTTLWEKSLSKTLKNYMHTHKNDPKLERAKELALLNSYGRGGIAAGVAAARRLSRLKPANFIQSINKPLYASKGKNLTAYLTEIHSRQKSLISKLPQAEKTAFEQTGAHACINN
ncbi:MAG: hypothetical protein ACK41T_10165 [Pseudobdellovibrio sp.]